MIRVLVGSFVLVAGTACLILVILAYSLGRPILYEIADGYKGWAVVRYEDPSCSPLKHEGIFVAVPVTLKGVGCVSNPAHEGWQINFFEYVLQGKMTRRLPQTRWGGGGEIWARFTMPSKHSESFFVGSEQDLDRSWSQEPR